jgi:hypothetical protein
MELEEWLKIYQAVSLTSGVKERSYWTILGIFLLTNGILILSGAFLALTYTLHDARIFSTALGGIGIVTALCWLVTQHRVAREVIHWESLLRNLEGEFAGAEFHRSIYKLLQGNQVCVTAADWICDEWHPTVGHLSWITRATSKGLLALLPLVFLLAWIALVVASWVI